MTNSDIVQKMETLKVDRRSATYADSAEPKSIEEIRRSGYNIKATIKGADSIAFGIDIIKQKTVHVTKRSINMWKEYRRYKWAEDKNGKSLGIPIDAYNHLMDAFRYIAMMVLRKMQKAMAFNPIGIR